MNKQVLDYIKMLSLSDKKTLSQKALKVSEECGELASVILPYDNAAGTTHRFIAKNRILEEAVDTILSAISIPYELGYTHEDIENMMQHKAEKWQGLQAKEAKVDYPLPYEIHITVELGQEIDPNSSEWMEGALEEFNWAQLSLFKQTCKELEVKPIILDLEHDGKFVMKDAMTSSKHIGNNASSLQECDRISRGLINAGFIVVRSKIETVPWHPAAPSEDGDVMPNDCYFEAHVGCIISPEEKGDLTYIAKNCNAHLSRNFFKKLEDGKFVNMVTLRKYEGTYDEFIWDLDRMKDVLTENDIIFDKVITEFAIYDTKVSHDFLWLEKETK